MKKRVCIFCGANPGNSNEIRRQTQQLVDLLIEHDYDLVYGGSTRGLMGLVADRFLAQGREVIGVRPTRLMTDEDVHTSLTELIVVKDMLERKAVMMEKSDLFIALPGGLGTLDELLEVYTHVKLGYFDKFCGVLNTNNFYEGLQRLLGRMVQDQFLREQDRNLLGVSQTPEALMDLILRREKLIDKIAYIHLHQGKILSTRSKGRSKYYIPGGKREKGETDEATLIREIQEELNVHLIPSTIRYMDTFYAQADGQQEGVQVRLTCYEADYHGQFKPSNEIQELKWLNYKDIDMVAEVDKKIFAYLRRSGVLE